MRMSSGDTSVKRKQKPAKTRFTIDSSTKSVDLRSMIEQDTARLSIDERMRNLQKQFITNVALKPPSVKFHTIAEDEVIKVNKNQNRRVYSPSLV